MGARLCFSYVVLSRPPLRCIGAQFSGRHGHEQTLAARTPLPPSRATRTAPPNKKNEERERRNRAPSVLTHRAGNRETRHTFAKKNCKPRDLRLIFLRHLHSKQAAPSAPAMQRSVVPGGGPGSAGSSTQQVLLAQQRTVEQRSSASTVTVREAHTRAQETRVSQQTFTSQQQTTNTTHRGT